MIRFLFLILCSGLAVSAHAQIARWSLHARYDTISLDNNGIYLVGKDGKFGLADTNVDTSKLHEDEDIDKKAIILPVQYDSIAPFKNGYAVIFNKTNGLVEGFVDEKGEFTNLTEWEYSVGSGYPYFSSGYLLVEKGMESFFIDAKDVTNRLGPFINARPFFNDIAVVQYYENPEKKNGDSFWAYLDANTKEYLKLPFTPKEDRVNFISSYSNGMSVVCYDKEFFTYNWKDSIATPFLEKREKKSVNVKANDKLVMPLLRSNLTEYEVMAKNGLFVFDQYMRLKSVELPGEEPVAYEIETEQLKDITTQLTIFPDNRGENEPCGLNYKHQTILPPQFQDIRIVKPIEAIVKKDGKYGILVVDETGQFIIKINDNREVVFRQTKENVGFEFSMPIYIRKPDLRSTPIGIECNTPGCRLELDNLKENSSIISHGFIDRDRKKGCYLTLPEDLEEGKSKDFSFTINYDELKSVELKVPVQMSYVSPYDFVCENSEYKDSTLTVFISIKAKDNMSIPFEYNENEDNIRIIPQDSNYIWETSFNKMSDGRYSADFNVSRRTKVFFFDVELKKKGTPNTVFHLKTEQKKEDIDKPQKVEMVQGDVKIVPTNNSKNRDRGIRRRDDSKSRNKNKNNNNKDSESGSSLRDKMK